MKENFPSIKLTHSFDFTTQKANSFKYRELNYYRAVKVVLFTTSSILGSKKSLASK